MTLQEALDRRDLGAILELVPELTEEERELAGLAVRELLRLRGAGSKSDKAPGISASGPEPDLGVHLVGGDTRPSRYRHAHGGLPRHPADEVHKQERTYLAPGEAPPTGGGPQAVRPAAAARAHTAGDPGRAGGRGDRGGRPPQADRGG